jgi:hypothetical protein
MAREARIAAHTAFAEYLDQRLIALEERYLDVFRQQLATARRSTSHPPSLVAQADLNAFRNEVHDLPTMLRAELRQQLAEWYMIAEQGGIQSTVDDLVEGRLTQAVASLETEGDRLFYAAT